MGWHPNKLTLEKLTTFCYIFEMGMPKGRTGNPNGRPVGAVNKSTAMAREAIAAFVDGNADRLTGWLDQIAEDNPKAAFDCFMSVVEYHIPKLARTELSGGLSIAMTHEEALNAIANAANEPSGN